jgi:hypothetical protein
MVTQYLLFYSILDLTIFKIFQTPLAEKTRFFLINISISINIKLLPHIFTFPFANNHELIGTGFMKLQFRFTVTIGFFTLL